MFICKKASVIQNQTERQRPEGSQLSADKAATMRAKCWPDKLMRATAPTMINHVAKSAQMLNELQIGQWHLARFYSTTVSQRGDTSEGKTGHKHVTQFLQTQSND
jgi:hypothetical protein